MKKIVGLVLASVMALGTTAFAAGNVDTKGKKVVKKPVAVRKMKQQTGQNGQNMQNTKTAPTKKTVAKSRKHSTKRHRATRKSSRRHHKTTRKTAAKTRT